MTQPEVLALLLAFALLALLLFAIGLALMFRLGRARGRRDSELAMAGMVSGEREDAVRRSRAVLAGQAAEQLAPWLPDFPWDPNEIRFVGKPIDFIVFRGASLGKVEELVFVEVKTGSSGLSKVERSLRDAVREGRVSWAEYRPPQA